MGEAMTLKALRAIHGGMTQAQAAEALGMSQSVYNAVEQALDNGETLEKIGDLFGVRISLTIKANGHANTAAVN